MKLSEYLHKPLEIRQAHLDLSEPCLIHPCKGKTLKMAPLRGQHYKKAGILDEDIPRIKAQVCHKCSNSDCRSYFHTYLGSPKENFADRKEQGSYRGEGAWFNNGWYEIKWEVGMNALPIDFIPGRLPEVLEKQSKIRKSQKIKNATNGIENRQIKTSLGETLPDGFWWGHTQIRTTKTCPHCGLVGGSTNMVRYHFDNCKHKIKE
jgi:hypothetical protein